MKPFVKAQWDVAPIKFAATLGQAWKTYPQWTAQEARDSLNQTFEGPD
jgi:hypothetical protein